MEKAELIGRLKQLESRPELAHGFPSQHAAMQWAAEVAPLLAFEAAYHKEFRERAHRMGSNISQYAQETNLRRMVALVHEAVVHLEFVPDPELSNDAALAKGAPGGPPAETPELAWPQQVTLAWAWKYVPWAAWLGLVTLMVAVFVAGISVGRLLEQVTNPSVSTATPPSTAPAVKQKP